MLINKNVNAHRVNNLTWSPTHPLKPLLRIIPGSSKSLINSLKVLSLNDSLSTYTIQHERKVFANQRLSINGGFLARGPGSRLTCLSSQADPASTPPTSSDPLSSTLSHAATPLHGDSANDTTNVNDPSPLAAEGLPDPPAAAAGGFSSKSSAPAPAPSSSSPISPSTNDMKLAPRAPDPRLAHKHRRVEALRNKKSKLFAYPPAQRTQIRETWKRLMLWSSIFKDRSSASAQLLPGEARAGARGIRTTKVVVFGGGSFGTAMATALAMRDPVINDDWNSTTAVFSAPPLASASVVATTATVVDEDAKMAPAPPSVSSSSSSVPKTDRASPVEVGSDRSFEVVMLLRDAKLAADINERHCNTKYLKDFTLPANIRATTDAREAITGAHFAVHAVPVQASRAFLRAVKDILPPHVPIICVSKGLEVGTGQMMSEVIHHALERRQPAVFLSGPSFAKEVMQGRPTGVVAASRDMRLARTVQSLFASPTMRVNTTTDVVGVEVCGALKNVLAIAAGIVQGLDLGHNAMAALISQGCSEIRWLSQKLGARATTMSGLSGLGDIMLTCYGDLSRNRSVGVRLGMGERLEDILASSQVAEGVATAGVVVALAHRYNVSLPVLTAVAQVLSSNLTPREAVNAIMDLPQIEEK